MQIRPEKASKPQFDLVVTGAFAVIALALIVIGVFSLMANRALLQTHGVGIRFALGTTQKNILKMVLIKGLALSPRDSPSASSQISD